MNTSILTSESPTTNQWKSYQLAFDHFNIGLFDGELPHCMLNFSRHKNAYGFFAPRRWENAEDSTDEISLNPDLLSRPMEETMSTLVHEMAHLWQFSFGTPSRRSYHNREWARKMEEIGLTPSDTGRPGGKKTGNRVSHYISETGKFAEVFANMPADYLLPWKSRFYGMSSTKKASQKSKRKYSCLNCGTNVWGKYDLKIICGICTSSYVGQ